MNAGSGGKKSLTSLHNTVTGPGNKTFFGKVSQNILDNNLNVGTGEMTIQQSPQNNNQESAELYYNKIETDDYNRTKMNTIQHHSDDIIDNNNPYGFRLNNGDEIDDEIV